MVIDALYLEKGTEVHEGAVQLAPCGCGFDVPLLGELRIILLVGLASACWCL